MRFVLLCILLLCTHPLLAAPRAPTSQPSAASGDALEKAISVLIDQSNTFTSEPGDPVTLEFRRPQKFIAELPPDVAPLALQRMTKSFAGNELKDNYIRFHLIPLVLDAKPEYRKESGKQLMELLKLVPAKDTLLDWRYPHFYEPKDLGKKWFSLVNSCGAYKGFPPFQVYVGPPESFEYMKEDQRRAAEARWAEAQALEKQIKKKEDKTSGSWNASRDWHLWSQRQYRADLARAMVQSGNEGTFGQLCGAMGVIAKEHPGYAADMMAQVNAAFINGELEKLYDQAALRSAAQKLKQGAIVSAAKWENSRSFAEATFHFVKSVESGRKIERPNPNAAPPSAPTTAPSTQPVTPDTLALDRIDFAMARAVAALLKRSPPDGVVDWHNWALAGHQHYPWHLVTPGHQSLVVWALMASGQPYQSPEMQKKINWMLCYDSGSTYDRAMRLMALQLLPPKGMEDYVKRDRDGLIAAVTAEGNFPEQYWGDTPTGQPPFSDNATGQYGVMGWSASESMNQSVPLETWKKVDKYWRDGQFKKPTASIGAWAMISQKSIQPGNDPGAPGKVSGPMTAAGIMALSQSERFILGDKRAEIGAGSGFSSQLISGVNWLDKNFSLDAVDGDQDWYYYMWTVQNVGHYTGLRRFNDVDWFREGTARLLNEQGADGYWKGPKGETVSTCFALLYLYRARGPLAISKLRFTPVQVNEKLGAANWNNRPNDLVNFTDYLTTEFETPTSWQVAQLDQPLHELVESRLLYLATDKAFNLSDDDIKKLREYINAGGLLVCAPEGTKPGPAITSMKALAKKLFPEQELQKIDRTHAIYSTPLKPKTVPPASIVSNGIRPLMILLEKDVGRDLQIADAKAKETFATLANIYMYASGQDSRRPRLESDYLISPAKDAERTIAAARIKYDGVFDPEPLALPQLSAMLLHDHGIALNVETVPVAELSDKHKLAFLTLTPGAKLDDATLTALCKWAESGGTLWIDCAAGDSAAALMLESMLPKLSTDSMKFSAMSDELSTSPYKIPQLGRRKFSNDTSREPVQVAKHDDRIAIIASKADVTCGLAGIRHWGIAGFDPTTARRLVANSVLGQE